MIELPKLSTIRKKHVIFRPSIQTFQITPSRTILLANSGIPHPPSKKGHGVIRQTRSDDLLSFSVSGKGNGFENRVIFVHIEHPRQVLRCLSHALRRSVMHTRLHTKSFFYKLLLIRKQVLGRKGQMSQWTTQTFARAHHVSSKGGHDRRVTVYPFKPSAINLIEIRFHIKIGFMKRTEIQLPIETLLPPKRRTLLLWRHYAPRSENRMGSSPANTKPFPITPRDRPLLHERLPVHDKLERASRGAARMPLHKMLASERTG